MTEIIALSALTIFTFYYVYFITKVRIGLYNLRRAEPQSDFPFVSVIIAARNEENNIGHCIESLIKQTYPKDKYEIIIIDDRSTDKTVEIARSFQHYYCNLNIISIEKSTILKNGGKINAITFGIERAKGEIILTTDADCIAPVKWIEIMSRHLVNDISFVAGPVAEYSITTFFSKMEQLELLGLITTAAGLIGANRPIICNGANLGYKKSAFIAAIGYAKNNVDNDDELIMNKIVCQKIGKVAFAPEPEAVILTKSSNTIISFLQQRIRWANKRGHYQDKSILVSLVMLYFFFFTLFIMIFLIPANLQLLIPFFIAFFGKVFIDYLTLRAGAKMFKQSIPIFHFFVAEILHAPYIVFAALIGQLLSLKWKGRYIN